MDLGDDFHCFQPKLINITQNALDVIQCKLGSVFNFRIVKTLTMYFCIYVFKILKPVNVVNIEKYGFVNSSMKKT